MPASTRSKCWFTAIVFTREWNLAHGVSAPRSMPSLLARSLIVNTTE